MSQTWTGLTLLHTSGSSIVTGFQLVTGCQLVFIKQQFIIRRLFEILLKFICRLHFKLAQLLSCASNLIFMFICFSVHINHNVLNGLDN